MRKNALLGLVVLLFIGVGLRGETDPRDLVVFPEILPPAPAVFDDSSPPVVRWDKVPHATQTGVTLVAASKSPGNAPEAMMAYDSGGGETLLVHVIDDAKVLAPATRLGQESLQNAASVSGVPVMKPLKIAIHPLGRPASAIDGYLTRRDPREPLLVLVIPDQSTGEDRFVVSFSWLAVREDRAEIMAAWLQKAAATIDLVKLQAVR